MQTKKGSIAEAWANIAVGFTINYFANMCIFPLFGMHISWRSNFLMGCLYTVISLVRSYVLRRWFNGLKFGNSQTVTMEIRPYPNPAPEVELLQAELRDRRDTDIERGPAQADCMPPGCNDYPECDHRY